MTILSLAVGAALGLLARSLLARAVLLKFRSDLRHVNRGDHTRLLKAYARDAVIHFNEGPHRFSGTWRGRDEIDRFLRNFTGAGLQGEIVSMGMSGPPWALTLWARFDDAATAPSGEHLYANRSAVVLRTRWGKVVDHEDFWVDTAPIVELETKLNALGIAPVPRP